MNSEIQQLKKELKKYKKAYNVLICYFDSISDEEQIKVERKLKKIFDEK